MADQHPDSTNEHVLKATLERFEGHHAVVRTDDAQQLLVPRTHLPHDAVEGADLWIVIQTNASREAERRANAKALLNEIMNPEI